jgi:hypothetical protein
LRLGIFNYKLTDIMIVLAEGPGGGDGATVGDVVKGELSDAEEAAQVQTQTNAPLEDVKVIMETEETKV